MLTFERKYSFETKILNNGEPSFVDGLRADVKEPDAEYLRPDFVYSARQPTLTPTLSSSLFHLLPCRATDGSSVPQDCAHLLFPWLLESTLVWLVILACYTSPF